MAEFKSPAEFDDELVSAYLDGELTAEERARVEERLAADPAAAQLLDELRSVSGAVRALPRERLPSSLRDSVLAGLDAARVDDEPRVVSLPYTGADRWAGVKRGLVWSSLAIAATLLLMALQPGEEAGRPVADRRQGESSSAGENKSGLSDESNGRASRSVADVPSFRAPASGAGDAAEAESGGGGRNDEDALNRASDVEEEGEIQLEAQATGTGTNEIGSPRDRSGDRAIDMAQQEPAASADGRLKASSAAPGLDDASSLASGSLDELTTDGAPTGAGEDNRERRFAENGAAAPPPAEATQALPANRSALQLVELTVAGSRSAAEKEFEQALAAYGIELSAEALLHEGSAGEKASETLASADSILVEATPEQIDKIVARYRGRAVAVTQRELRQGADELAQQAPAAAPSGMRSELDALAGWASGAADKDLAKRVAGATSTELGVGQAWRLYSSADPRTERPAEGAVRIGAGAPLATSSNPAAAPLRTFGGEGAGSGKPAAAPAENATRKESASKSETTPRVRVLFLLRPATTAPAEPEAAAESGRADQ